MTLAAQEKLAEVWLAEYDRLRDSIRRQVRNYDLAEDITMQAFAELGEHIETTKTPGAWVWRAAQSRVADIKRQEKRRPNVVSLNEDITEEELPQYRPFQGFDSERFDTAVRTLPESERDAFILTELRGLTVREAAEILGTSKSDVDRRAKLATTRVREELLADAA